MKKLPSVLVVDDEEIIRSLLADAAAARGFAVHTAASGEEALKMIREHPFPVVVLDILLPGITGRKVAEEIARLHPKTRFIILTGGSASAAEFSDIPQVETVLGKPFPIADFLQVLEKLAGAS